MRALYNSNSNAEDIAIAGIEAAADFDDCSGLPYEIYKINLIES
jgi:ATP-dependent protease HslVU (ClpYQ) peptidase subunit